MVTAGPEDVNQLQKLLAGKSIRWNLTDASRRDSWMLRTRSALRKNNMLDVLEHGPPTADVIMLKNDTLSARKAEQLAEQLMPTHQDQALPVVARQQVR